MNSHPDCYGEMFPPVGVIAHEREVRGQVFGYRVEQPGVISTASTARVDRAAWEACASCPDFENCHRLSTGRLLMELATRN